MNHSDTMCIQKISDFLIDLKDKGILKEFNVSEKDMLDSYEKDPLNIFDVFLKIIEENIIHQSKDRDEQKNYETNIYYDVLFEVEKSNHLYGGGVISDLVLNIFHPDYLKHKVENYKKWYFDIKKECEEKKDILDSVLQENVRTYWMKSMYDYLDCLIEDNIEEVGVGSKKWKDFVSNVESINKEFDLGETKSQNSIFLMTAIKLLYISMKWDLLEDLFKKFQINIEYCKDSNFHHKLVEQLSEDDIEYCGSFKLSQVKKIASDTWGDFKIMKQKIREIFVLLDKEYSEIITEVKINEINSLDFEVTFRISSDISYEIKENLLKTMDIDIDNICNEHIFNLPAKENNTYEQVIREGLLKERMEDKEQVVQKGVEKSRMKI